MLYPKYFDQAGERLLCRLCPHACVLGDGSTGLCGVRKNDGGNLSLPYAGLLSATALDPIEKKPLYHFYPGSAIFSIGFFGCNLHCPFCQNYTISQEFSSHGQRYSPEDIVNLARRSGSFGIAYTYSEPLVHYEYVLETSRLAREKGLKNVLVSNGYLNPAPVLELLPWLDAANIDIKSFSDGFYRSELGGSLEPVMDFIRFAAERIHLEVTTLIIPGKNDTTEEIEEIACFLAELNRNIPLHLSCYFPRYKYTTRATSYHDLFPLLAAARKHLFFVYAGNVGGDLNTLCPECKALLVSRRGYKVEVTGITSGKCLRCGNPVPIIG